ncbi:MAG TPA: alpha/beta hydrolase [Negativicutes bacterium]|nr:alpha/beta hydrolase [Negativicutes bacterium]
MTAVMCGKLRACAVFVLLISFLASGCAQEDASKSGNTGVAGQKTVVSEKQLASGKDCAIEEFFPINVNDSEQWLLVRGKDLSKPVILYLHGGPGSSLVPFAHAATNRLVDEFIVVYWDQRGAGLSYSDRISPETMNVNQFIDDTKVVTRYLKERFKKEKIYILGHSWGSVLGTLVVQKYPEDYYAYIGVGQVVNTEIQQREGVEWLKRQILTKGTQEEKELIPDMENNNHAPRYLLKKYGGLAHNITGSRLAEIMKQSPYYPEKYTGELYAKGGRLASNIWYNEVAEINFFEQVPELKVPVYFFLGRYDYVTPTPSVEEYCKVLKAPNKEIVWFELSAHRMDVEEPEKFQSGITDIARKHK